MTVLWFCTVPAETTAFSLDAFLATLARHPAVDGVLLMASTKTGALTTASDDDLLLVLAGAASLLRMIVTWIDWHLTEVYCTSTPARTRIVAEPAHWREGSEEDTVIRRLQTGRIARDRDGHLGAAQHVARKAPPPERDTERDAFGSWWTISYNVAQAKRYLSPEDPIYQEVVDFRLLYNLADVMMGYFAVRGLPWRGEKEAIR